LRKNGFVILSYLVSVVETGAFCFNLIRNKKQTLLTQTVKTTGIAVVNQLVGGSDFIDLHQY